MLICGIIAKKRLKRISEYIWAAIIILVAFLWKGSYLRNFAFPPLDAEFIKDFFIYFAAAALISGLSNYQYGSKNDNIKFVIFFPIAEEILFRGIILALLLNTPFLAERASIVVCGLLFGVMHIQYFGFTKIALRKVVIAAVGGYFFSTITVNTGSIIPALLLHMVFNFSAILFDKYRRKKTSQ